MPITAEDTQNAVLRYEREIDRYTKLADVVYERCLQLVEDVGVRATVQRRAKSPQSLRKKLLQIQRKDPPDTRYSDVDSIFAHMGDLAAVRVATYLESERELVIKELGSRFTSVPSTEQHPNPDEKDKSGRAKHYRAVHCQVGLTPDDLQGANANLAGTSCEIQVCSMLAHVWNEIEHDLGYKPETGVLSEAELDCLEALGQQVRASDTIMKALLDANRARVAVSDTPFGNAFDFMTRMQQQFPKAATFHKHARQLFDVLLEFGLDSPTKIREALLGDGDAYRQRSAGLVQQLADYLTNNDDQVVAVKPETSDVLAVLLFEEKLADLLALYPTGRGMGRPMRLISLAKRFGTMRQQPQPAAAPTGGNPGPAAGHAGGE